MTQHACLHNGASQVTGNIAEMRKDVFIYDMAHYDVWQGQDGSYKPATIAFVNL